MEASCLAGSEFHFTPAPCGKIGCREVIFSLVLAVTLIFNAPSAHAMSCKSLSGLILPDTQITLAQSVSSGQFMQPASAQAPSAAPKSRPRIFKNLPVFCRVAAEVKPAKDSDIHFEVWMPISNWNGRFEGVGNGGWAGIINYRRMSEALRGGFATASTDTGHGNSRAGAKFALHHREKVIDFGYRSVHLMTERAKSIVHAYYGAGPRFAYWNSCSTGGRQGLAEAQLFPADYNGIVVGDPANYFTHLRFAALWPAEITLEDPSSYIPPSKLRLIHRAVLKACDALDGVKDGLLDDPMRCNFDPGVLLCKGHDSPSCLTSAQIKAAREMYAGPKNPRTGEPIFPGLEPGSELGWRFYPHGIKDDNLQLGYFKYVLFENPDWKWQSLNFDTDVALADRRDGKILNAIDPDLSAFENRGGKLLLYHGWSDPLIAPLNSIDYYRSVNRKMGGASKTRDFIRLFMVPGMLHCDGGPGPDSFDRMGAIERWVEQGEAPDKIVAAHRAGDVVDMTRPLCPYPGSAQWKGSGSTNDAKNFVCANR